MNFMVDGRRDKDRGRRIKGKDRLIPWCWPGTLYFGGSINE
jgi:hypothetical protein